MRNLEEKNLERKNNPNLNLSKLSKRINCQISEPLLIKCQNFLTSQHLARNYTYANLSDLIRKSLIEYKENKLTLTTPRPVGQPKKIICIVLSIELWEYYRSLPERFRVNILESCLVNYLNII